MTALWRSLAAFAVLLLFPGCARSDTGTHKVTWQQVRENGLVATYLRPKGEHTVPAVIVLGGSEGGIPTWTAYQFAEHGWGALAVAYFGVEGLPAALADVPLEYFDAAITWLQRQPRVDAANLSLIGASRGGELALLLATRKHAFHRVIAIVPSDVIWGPVGRDLGKDVSPFTVDGRPLPFATFEWKHDDPRKAYRGTPDFLAALQTPAADAAAIPVEKIQAAVLLLSGEDDQIWPSALMSRRVMARLEAKGHPYRFEHVSYPDAGHILLRGIDPAVTEFKHPMLGILVAFGGTAKGNRAAQEQAWTKMLEFLRAGPRPPRAGN